jgi:hypothetical protein
VHCNGWRLFWRPMKLICLYLLFCLFLVPFTELLRHTTCIQYFLQSKTCNSWHFHGAEENKASGMKRLSLIRWLPGFGRPSCFHIQGKIISRAWEEITVVGVDVCDRDIEGHYERGRSFVRNKLWRTGENCSVEENMWEEIQIRNLRTEITWHWVRFRTHH